MDPVAPAHASLPARSHRQGWKSLPLFESSETLEFELDIASQSNAQSFRHNHNLTQELQRPRTRWRDPKVTHRKLCCYVG